MYKERNSTRTLIQRTITEAPHGSMYYIGLDVHNKTISYCVKDASGQVLQEGKTGDCLPISSSTRSSPTWERQQCSEATRRLPRSNE